MKNYIALGALLVLLWSAPLRAQSYSYEAEHRADGTIAITVIGTRSLRSGPDNFSMPLADKLEEAAATECGGEYDLTQDPMPQTEMRGERFVAKLHGVATCRKNPETPAGA